MKKILPLAFALATLLARPAAAEMADGSYEFSFESDTPLWDITGDYYQEVAEDLALDYTIVMDMDGKFTGSGFAEFTGDVGDEFVDLVGEFSFSGKLMQAGSVTRVSMKFRTQGEDDSFGVAAAFRATVKQTLEIDPDFQEFFGTARPHLRAKVAGQGTLRVRSQDDVWLSLPDDMDGTWWLFLNAFSSDNGYFGTAQIELFNGATLFFDLSGSYSPGTDLSSLQLKGVDIFRSSNLRLTTTVTDGDMTLQTLNGSVLGQSLRFRNAN